MLGSYRLLRQIAHVSVQMAHDHMATALHFLTSNLQGQPTTAGGYKRVEVVAAYLL
jgi:hypothetical protein